jgi:hypothetical protein
MGFDKIAAGDFGRRERVARRARAEGPSQSLPPRQTALNSRRPQPVYRGNACLQMSEFALSWILLSVRDNPALSLCLPREPQEAIYAGNSPNLRELRRPIVTQFPRGDDLFL